MDECNIIYKGFGYFKYKVYLYMNDSSSICYVDSKSIKDIYILLDDDWVYLVVDKNIKAYCKMCTFKSFINEYCCNYRQLLLSYNIIELNNLL